MCVISVCARQPRRALPPPSPSSHPPLIPSSLTPLQLEHQLRQGALNMQALAFHCQVRVRRRGRSGRGLSQQAAELWPLRISIMICTYAPDDALTSPPPLLSSPPLPQGPAASLKLLASVAAEAASKQLTSAGEEREKGRGRGGRSLMEGGAGAASKQLTSAGEEGEG